jgi:hypothetical protein
MCPACEQNCSRSWPGSKLGLGIRSPQPAPSVFRTIRTVTIRPEMNQLVPLAWPPMAQPQGIDVAYPAYQEDRFDGTEAQLFSFTRMPKSR